MGKCKLVINPSTGKLELVKGGGASGTGDTVVFYRNCNVHNDTWLNINNTTSNVNGVKNKFDSAQITKACVRNMKSTSFDLELYEHDGNLANQALIATLSVNSDDQDFNLTQPLTLNKQLAAKVSNLSGDRPVNLKVEILIEGT